MTDHPTAAWTLQQLREAIPSDHCYQYLLRDRDRIYSAELDRSVQKLGLRVLKSPYRSPLANCVCERVIRSLRRECLDLLIPLTQLHLLRTVKDWTSYYNTARPHMSLGPGIPSPPGTLPVALIAHRHRPPEKQRVYARPILGDLHRDYRLIAA
ncbi:MAG: integrase core domain-containing protein [Pseudomonadota bacterium]|nr:integrase core domain-containing protein [Pseudomonadota bacterium]